MGETKGAGISQKKDAAEMVDNNSLGVEPVAWGVKRR
jgi:hypothetical protein